MELLYGEFESCRFKDIKPPCDACREAEEVRHNVIEYGSEVDRFVQRITADHLERYHCTNKEAS
jgi:hypothetical protein